MLCVSTNPVAHSDIPSDLKTPGWAIAPWLLSKPSTALGQALMNPDLSWSSPSQLVFLPSSQILQSFLHITSFLMKSQFHLVTSGVLNTRESPSFLPLLHSPMKNSPRQWMNKTLVVMCVCARVSHYGKEYWVTDLSSFSFRWWILFFWRGACFPQDQLYWPHKT